MLTLMDEFRYLKTHTGKQGKVWVFIFYYPICNVDWHYSHSLLILINSSPVYSSTIASTRLYCFSR